MLPAEGGGVPGATEQSRKPWILQRFQQEAPVLQPELQEGKDRCCQAAGDGKRACGQSGAAQEPPSQERLNVLCISSPGCDSCPRRIKGHAGFLELTTSVSGSA